MFTIFIFIFHFYLHVYHSAMNKVVYIYIYIYKTEEPNGICNTLNVSISSSRPLNVNGRWQLHVQLSRRTWVGVSSRVTGLYKSNFL